MAEPFLWYCTWQCHQRVVDLDPSKTIETAAAGFGLLGLNTQIPSILSRVVVPLAVEAGALILDDAKSSGCAALIAQAALDQDKAPTIIGVIAHDRADNDVDPNHELVLRLPAAWSGQTKYLFQLAAGLAAEGTASNRIAVLLFGGAPRMAGSGCRKNRRTCG